MGTAGIGTVRRMIVVFMAVRLPSPMETRRPETNVSSERRGPALRLLFSSRGPEGLALRRSGNRSADTVPTPETMSRGGLHPMDEDRRRWLIATLVAGCSLRDAAEAIAGHARADSYVYVEERTDGYRWSPTHRGGPYPLHREVALVIDVPYNVFMLPFETIDGSAVVRAEDPRAASVIRRGFVRATSEPDENVARILAALDA